jgi:pimeloyl-ACP methyl ester carboxylesterase
MVDHANDLLDVVDDCVEGGQAPPIVVAHSFGSNPTMLAATLRPSAFAAIGLWEPPLPWVAWWSEATTAYNATVAASNQPSDDIEAMYRSLLGDEVWDQLPPTLKARRRAEGDAFQVDMASELRAPFKFEDVLVMALVGYGAATSAEHCKGARWLVDRVPHAQLHRSPGAGHFAPRTHPAEFAAFVTAVTAVTAVTEADPEDSPRSKDPST